LFCWWEPGGWAWAAAASEDGWEPDSRLGEGVRNKNQGLAGLKAQFDVAF